MNIRSLRRKAAKTQFAKPLSKFEQIDISLSDKVPRGMTRAYRNTRFTVMVYDNQLVSPQSGLIAICALIQKHDDTPIHNHWKTIQSIKNELFGEEVTAVEYYPAESNLVDNHNIYWIWIFPEGKLPIPIIR